MVFAVVCVKIGTKVIKNWYGCNIRDTYSLIELYNNFCAGQIDHVAPLDDNNNVTARVTVALGKTKDFRKNKK